MAASYGRTTSDDGYEIIDTSDLLYVKLTGEDTSESRTHLGKIPTAMPVLNSQVSPISKRTSAMQLEDFHKLLDDDGRLVDESTLRKTIFLGGLEPGARREVWQYLFALYPCSSTKREREVLLLDYIVKYNEMKNRWKNVMKLTAPPGATELEQGLVAKYQLEEESQVLVSPDFTSSAHTSSDTSANINQTASTMENMEPDYAALSKHCQFLDMESQATKQQIAFMKIQAKVYVDRLKIDTSQMKSHVRIIDKDVPRTDRDVPYFMDARKGSLSMLREILITYATIHPDVGYAQGMNDILARFLFVFDSEAEAYWCFHNYLEKVQVDFLEEGMVRKIELVRKLLLEMDPGLLEHLEKHELGDLLFCHRWLLLGFKREFTFMDSLRVFEILSSHHLELSSIEAETAKRKQAMKEFAEIGGVTRTTPMDTDAEFTFELFMCVALLQECRASLLNCLDAAMVFDVINRLEINLDSILEKSEHLFFRYCKKTVEDSFLMVETPSFKKKR